MRKQFLFTLMYIMCCTVFVQGQSSTRADTPDPAAERLLDQMEAYLEGFEAIEVTFDLGLSFPGEEPITYSGTFNQQGNQFRIDVGAYQILCDGITRWVHLPADHEVNIYNADGIDGPQTPIDFLELYQSEDFIYAITGRGTADGQPVDLIEFKPVDKYSDFSKIRLSVRTSDHAPVRVEVFEKGGARSDLMIKKVSEVEPHPDQFFRFDINGYPDIRVEDLRID